MKILVTGSNGCVGQSLKRLNGYQNNWVFLDRSQCDLMNYDQTNQIFQDIAPDAVIHLAAYVPGFYNIDRVASFSHNILINENVLAASHRANVQKMLVGLSVNMFGDSPATLPLDESMIFDGHISGGFAGYGYSKRMLELQCQNYNQQYGRQYFGIIPCNIYGPHDNFKSGRLIPNLLLKFKEAKKNNTNVIINGSGRPLRQFINSTDLSLIIQKLIIEYQDTKPIICCPEQEITIKELAQIIAAVIGFRDQIEFDDSKPDGTLQKTMSNKYLKKILNKPDGLDFTSLENGLNETLTSIKNL